MLKLRVVQAAYGDRLILELGSPAQPKYILIDGGPPDIYQRHLKGELQRFYPAAANWTWSLPATLTMTTSWG